MSKGAHNSSHPYNGRNNSRGNRLKSKLGKGITLKRLEQLLGKKKKEGRG